MASNKPRTSMSQEVIDSLGDFTSTVSATLKTDVKSMLDSQSVILGERISHLQEFTNEKFKHLEERQVAENSRLKEQIEEVKTQVTNTGKLHGEISEELRAIKSDLTSVKGDLQTAKDGSGLTHLREEIAKTRTDLTEKITASTADLTKKIADTNTKLEATDGHVSNLTKESLVREGGRRVILAIYGAVGTSVIGGVGTLIYLAIKHWG